MHNVEKDGKLVSDLFHYKTEYGHHSHNISDFFFFSCHENQMVPIDFKL